MDKMIRELIVDVTQKGSARTAKSLEGVATAIDGITENSVKAKKALSEISSEIMQLEGKVKNTTSAMANLGSATNFSAFNKQLTSLNRNLSQLESMSQAVSGDLVAGMGKASAAAKELSTSLRGISASKAAFTSMSNSIGTAAASMSNLNKTLGFINTSLSTFSSFSSNSTKNLGNLTAAIANLTIQYGKLSSAISVAKFQLNDMAKAGDTSGLKDLSSTLNGINLTQRGAGTTAKSIAGIVTALQDAAAGAELAKNALREVGAELLDVEAKATKAGSAMQGMGKSTSLSSLTKQLSSVEDYLDELLTTMTVMSEKMTAGFSEISNSVNKMGNNVASAVEKSQDNLIGMEAGVRRVSTSMGAGSKAANDYTRAIGNTSGAARGATRDFAALKDAGGSLTKSYAILAANIFVVKAAFDQAMQGDQLNRLEQFGEVIGSINGTPVQALALSLQEAVGGAVSFQEAMKQASVASTYGFNADQLEKFGLVARRASAVLGIDMTDALDRVIKGVSKQEIELLDELGVTIKLNDAYAAYAQKLNAAGDGMQYNIQNLSTYQKQQAYANAVIDQSTQRLGYLDNLLRADAWETFAANANAALRSVQQAAATFLTPILDSINSIMSVTQSSQSAKAGRAQAVSNGMVNSDDTIAVAKSLDSSNQGLKKANEDREKALKARNDLQKKYDDAMAQTDWKTRAAVNQVAQGMPLNLATAFSSDEAKENIQNLAKMGLQLNIYDRELKDSSEATDAWGKAREVALSKAAKNNQLNKNLNVTDIPRVDGSVGTSYNSKAISGYAELGKNFGQIQKTSQALSGDMTAVASSTTKAASVSTQLADAVRTVNGLSGGTAANQDKYTKELGLGFNTYSELVKASKAYSDYSNQANKAQNNTYDVNKKIYDVYKATGSKDKAQAAGRELEMAQLDAQINSLKQIGSLGGQNAGVQGEITKLESQKLAIQNQGMETAKKVKDYSDKIVGTQEKIALLNNTTLGDYDYQKASLELQLKIEQERQGLLAGRADKIRDYNQSLVQTAELSRQIRENEKSHLDSLSQVALKQKTALREARGNRSDRDQLFDQQSDLRDEIAAEYANAKKAGTAANAENITDLNNQIDVLNKSIDAMNRARDMAKENNVISSLGGSYNAVDQNASQDMKDQNNVANQFNDYDSAISNLKSLNSEATTTAQSLGNLSMAMYEYSKGSINATTMASQGMQTVAQLVSFASNQQQSAIDAQIAAEQNRDGKSEESKAKIKKLEAEKLKIQQANAKKQIIISTAVAMMNAAATAPFLPLGLTMMATAAAAGALALASASSAASIPSSDSSTSTATSLSLGSRTNNIDVSQSANGGELSYIRGDRGIGTSQSFTPRAAGGDMVPGVSYLTGEKGIEVITPKVPSKATSASDLSSQSQSSQAPIIFQIHAMDASSFKDFAEKHSDVFRGTVEQSLNNNGLSLKNLESR